MPTKLQLYAQMADHTAGQITGSFREWTAFLETAARLYKYPYHEQLMIYAQRPDATACAPYDLWNSKPLNRYVRRGSRGIALIDTDGDTPKLKYVFDVSDTGGGENSRRPFLWEYRQEHEDTVTAALERRFDVSAESGFADQLEQISARLVTEYWNDHHYDILGIIADSFLEEYDNYNVEVAFRNAASVSTAYVLMSRCGLSPEEYFVHEDFLNVFDFNTPRTVAALGSAISQSSETVLRQIEVTIKNYEREKIAERSESYERNDLHEEWGLSDSRSEPERTTDREAPGQVREDAEELSEGTSSGTVEQPAAVGEIVSPSEGDRRDSDEQTGEDDARTDESGGRDGGTESDRPDEVGWTDEQLQSTGRGSDPRGAGAQLSIFDPPMRGEQLTLFPTEEEQIQFIREAESVSFDAHFAFSFAQEEIDHILRIGSNADYHRMKIAAEFSKGKSTEENAAYLSELFHGGNGIKIGTKSISAWYAEDGIHLASGNTSRYSQTAQIISWQDTAVRIGELLERGQYASNVELAEAPGYERKKIAETLWYLHGDLSESAHEQGYLSTLSDFRMGGFPDATARLAESLREPMFRQTLSDEFAAFYAAYTEDRTLLRFRYHKPQKLWNELKELSLPRREYVSDMAEIPAVNVFITEDEINEAISGGSNFEGSAGRIYDYFHENHTPAEKAAFLKKEYGTGGHSHALSRATGSGEDHDSKGIVYQKRDCPIVKLNWNQVVKYVDDLIRKGRYLTPETVREYEEYKREKAEIEARITPPVTPDESVWGYNDIKHDHPSDIVLYQMGDFFEMYGEDAVIAAALLDLNLTTRPLPGTTGRVDMCGIPAHALEQYVEKLRETHPVTIAPVDNDTKEHTSYSLPALTQDRDLPAEDISDAETGAYAPAADLKTQEETTDTEQALGNYKPIIVQTISEDTPYRNACAHSDPENAAIECNAAVRRAVLNSGDMELIRQFSDNPDFRTRLHQEAFADTYSRLHDLLRPLTQDDIDDALCAWNGNEDSKRAVIEYMKDHAREKETAAWLCREYGGSDTKSLFFVRAGSPEGMELPWAKVQRRIAQLIAEDRFTVPEPVMEPEHLEARYQVVVYHHIENGFDERLDYKTLAEAEQAAQGYIAGTMESDGFAYDGAAVYDLQERLYLRIFGDYPDEKAHAQLTSPPQFTTETVGFYPSDKTNLPYDVVIQSLRTNEPEHTPPTQTRQEPSIEDDLNAHPVSVQIGGEWQTFPNAAAAEEAMYEESKAQIRANAQNFRITDDHLGEGGPKAKYQANINAIRLLKELEADGRQALPEQQEVLSRYVGWGGLADAFDPGKEKWSTEYAELKELLTPSEYEAARASTLNAHYTSPTVINAIYEAVGKMGFKSGNILEPSMGVGNFFGMLPEEMQNSRLYGVELDSITGRIAQQLYPKANITVAGFETTDRRDFFDLAIGNVPFGQYQVDDKAYNKLGFSIHDYFFAKTLDQVRPGGVIAFVTSRYTMDKQTPDVRKYIAQRAELLGAIRLPNNAFKQNAGTEVVSDIIFLQKRDRPIDIEPEWVHLGKNEDGFSINSYFIDHPEMILGRQTSESTQYGRQDFTVAPIEGLELADQLHDAVKYIRGTYKEAELPDLGEGETIDTSIPADPDVKNYSYTVVDGEVYFRENSRMVKPELNATAAERVKGMVALRNCVNELIDLQMDEYTPESAITEKQNELNTLYDAFSEKYGLINDRANRLAFSDDSSYYLLCSLEVLDDDGNLKRKADMFHKRTIKQKSSVQSVDTATEALAVCIGEKACVDLSYMASLMGGSEKIPQIVEDLKGIIFKDPRTGAFDLEAGGDNWNRGWQTADEYLSGNVRQKLRTAQAAADRDPFFAGNVEALAAAQPKDLDASEIEVRLGATWLDKSYIQQFMYETFDTPRYLRGEIEVNYVPYTAEWQITHKTMPRRNDIAAYTTYGTDRANAYRLLEDALNLRDIRIYDTVEDADGRERRVLNAKETTLAAQKQQLIKDAFKDWIWKDPERRETLVRQYNEEMNSTRPREYDGSHIVFSGMNPEITLREHQRNAIAHVLYGGNTLLAHEVGAGKTFEMIAAAMESKRLGLCHKSIFVVPNHLTDQWASEFLRLYPSANILVTTKKDFETHNRKKFCARIATGDYDAVIIGHSQFERIPISPERQERLLREQIEEITEGIQEVKANDGENFTIKSLERTRKGLEARLKKLQDSSRKDDVITFEQLGVDRMFVDESDNYKNLFLYTKMRNVAGLSTTDAQKSSDMFAKCRYMDELTGNRGVIFATGTPVSNSMTELYTIQRYLQYDRLQEMGMGHFDCWASRFGETTTALELAPEGTGYRARTRFAKFFNLPELMNMFKEVADIKTADQLNLPTPEVEYHTYASKPTETQKEMVKALSERASKVHSGSVDPSVDNMLKITSDGRKLGLDQRIINAMLPDEESTKVNQCVSNILEYWRNGEDQKLTQLVFCDISTPRTAPSQRAAKAAPGILDSPEIRALENAITLDDEPSDSPFTVYEDVRQKLIAGGMASEQIAFIHDANTEVKKRELFGKVRSGQVRVLMGSTAKMGAGTNVQDRLIALHDLDCPWRPRDLTQRKGRIERQGNQNEKVHVCRYVTEGTFDAYLWQTVENKQRFISQIMTSKSPVRSCDDVDATALSFAEIKALCAGDPRIKERMDLDVEVSKLKIMKADHQSKQFRLEDSLLKYFPQQIEESKAFIRGFEADMQTLAAHPLPAEGFVGMEIRGDKLTDKENAGAALLDACKEVKDSDPVVIGSYRGFSMAVSFDSFSKAYMLTLKGEMTHRVELGSDARGNLIRIENALDKMPERLKYVQAQLENLYNQQAAAKAEVGKPFPQEEELTEKTARLIELDMELNLDSKGQAQPEQAIAKSSRPSVLDKLKAPPVPGSATKLHRKEMEVR